MRKLPLAAALAALMLCSAVQAKEHDDTNAKPDDNGAVALKPQSSRSEGSVSVEGKRIDYQAVAGTLVLHGHGDQEDEPQASMFYTAYFKKGAEAGKRPITFIYNGGPGSSSMWLHMGALGPKRVVTSDDMHTPAAPYGLVNNESSLLDASDLVFIDAPGTGFSRLIADEQDPAKRAKQLNDRKKALYSVDGDAHAFAQFITQFLSQYGRWNSPKYLLGESYGTTRSALLANILENEDSVDLNGVIQLSQILSFGNNIEGPQNNPGMDLPYMLALPSYAAAAYYHKKLAQPPASLTALLSEVESFATGEYAQALLAGAQLDSAHKQAVAEKLHQYTGLSVAYWLKADLRVSGGMFEHELLADESTTIGRLDTRFSGPSIDPLSKSVDYDPLASAISSAYVAVFNDYVRQQLKFGDGKPYRVFADVHPWDMNHKAPNGEDVLLQSPNVMPDLAMAMKTNPNLKVLVNGGYYDLATPFFLADYEMHHLPIPASLQQNISYAWYPSGHVIYANNASRQQLHDNVARFIEQTDNQPSTRH